MHHPPNPTRPGADEFQEGEVILTLKDTSVLAEGDENGVTAGLNEEDDELVNGR